MKYNKFYFLLFLLISDPISHNLHINLHINLTTLLSAVIKKILWIIIKKKTIMIFNLIKCIETDMESISIFEF